MSRGRGFDSQPEGLGVAFFATGPGLGLIMYIFTTLEFPTHYSDFHLLTTSVNAKYYYKYTLILHRHYHLINIYTELASKLSATASVAQLVEHWSSNPEVAGSIPSRKALELHFSQLVPVWVL